MWSLTAATVMPPGARYPQPHVSYVLRARQQVTAPVLPGPGEAVSQGFSRDASARSPQIPAPWQASRPGAVWWQRQPLMADQLESAAPGGRGESHHFEGVGDHPGGNCNQRITRQPRGGRRLQQHGVARGITPPAPGALRQDCPAGAGHDHGPAQHHHQECQQERRPPGPPHGGLPPRSATSAATESRRTRSARAPAPAAPSARVVPRKTARTRRTRLGSDVAAPAASR